MYLSSSRVATLVKHNGQSFEKAAADGIALRAGAERGELRQKWVNTRTNDHELAEGLRSFRTRLLGRVAECLDKGGLQLRRKGLETQSTLVEQNCQGLVVFGRGGDGK